MFDIITETFLQQYFLYSAILGKFCDNRALFDYVAELFFVPQDQRDELFQLTVDETVLEIATLSDTKRFNRINQYRELGGEIVAMDKTQEIIAIKSNAITMAMENQLLAENNATQSIVYNKLLVNASAGNVIALRVLGALQCDGGFVEKRFEDGLKHLNRAAQWGDMVSLLALLKYVHSDRRALIENVERLHAVVLGTEYESLHDKALAFYKLAGTTPSKEIQLLKKAFAVNRARPNVYDPLHARLLYGSAIELKDREKIIFSDAQGALTAVCDLPLKLTYGVLSMDVAALDSLPFKRDKEKSQLTLELRNVDLRQNDGYRPICISGSSNFVLETYAKALLNMEHETDHYERIDVADLKQYDFEPTGNNIFIRSAVDGKNNVFVLVLKGEIEDYAIEHIKSFLISSKRRRFRLNNPRVTLNLEAILPICVCDKANATKLASLVETVKVADVAAEEKRSVVNDMLESKSRYYLFKSIAVDDDVVDMLCNCSPDTAEGVIDRIFSENRFKENFDRVTAEELKPYVKVLQQRAQKAYGFGGYNKL